MAEAQTTRAPGRLRAGLAQVDISPAAGVHLSGDISTHRPAKLLADPLYAKALVLESNGRRLCIVALDVTIVTGRYTAFIREAAERRFGLEPDAVMVHATQTHSAPSIGTIMLDEDFPPLPPEFEWVGGGEARYSQWAAERAVEAIGLAVERLEPVQIGVGSGIEGRMAFNRRAVMRDGTVGMPGPKWQEPLGPTWIRYIEGPIDPELGVICLRRGDARMASVIASYTCHPVHVFPKPIISADWPGALSAELAAMHGSDCVPVVINGACGNINPWPPFDPDYVEDHRRMGRVLAEGAAKVMETLQFGAEADLAWSVTRLPVPIREVPEEELAWAQGVLAASPTPQWVDEARSGVDPNWMVAASIQSVHLMLQRGPNLDYEIQVLRIGDTAIVGLPGEPFAELGLAVKMASPFAHTYIAHCTSQYVGYIPSEEALKRGGHEASTRYWAKLAPEAFEMIVEGATEGLTRLRG